MKESEPKKKPGLTQKQVAERANSTDRAIEQTFLNRKKVIIGSLNERFNSLFLRVHEDLERAHLKLDERLAKAREEEVGLAAKVEEMARGDFEDEIREIEERIKNFS